MKYNRSRQIVDDGDVGLKVWYKPGGGTAAVDSSGNITLVGASTITIAIATYTTFGMVLDYINAQTGWKAILVDAKRSDSTSDTLLLMTTASVPPDGKELYKDTSVALNLAVAITNQDYSQDDVKIANILSRIVSKNTYGSGTSVIQVWELHDHDPSATERLMWQQDGGATTEEQSLPLYVNFEKLMAQGARLLVQMTGSAACTGYLGVIGNSEPLGNQFRY